MLAWIGRAALAACVAVLIGCGAHERDPAIGEAYIGPSTIQIRQDLGTRSEVAATVKHGDRLEVLAKRRRYLKVRTSAGAEGWIDSRQLLSGNDMEELNRLNQKARDLPAQAQAIVYDTLNVHTLPNRQAPSFFQIEARKPVDLLEIVRAPRVNYEARLELRSLAPPPRKKEAAAAKLPPPPPGPPPKLVENWQQLSRSTLPRRPLVAAKTAPAPAANAAAAAPLDEWSLVRDSSRRSGWVLTRMLFLTIPDEVAQYAERARIVAFFQLTKPAASKDGKPVWLWATLGHPGGECQFDSVRVFVYSSRRHHYETAFIERDICGMLPVAIVPRGAAWPGFAYLFENDSGGVMRKEYAFQGVRPRLASKKPVEAPKRLWQVGEPGKNPETEPDTPEPERGIARWIRDWIESIKARLGRTS